MITRKHGNLHLARKEKSVSARLLEADGCVVLPNVLSPHQVDALRAELDEVFLHTPIDRPQDVNNEWRHAVLNVSALAQEAIGAQAILDTIEPLLGEDCHVIANTVWRNVKGHQGGAWHIDAGPHVPRPEGVAWPEAIPYPIFAIGAHIFLEDCPKEAGPTAVLVGSHTSGQTPPFERIWDLDLTWNGASPRLLTAKAGDVALFVSDVWHRGTPAQDGFGRYFLQAHYGRRDIAQRLQTTDQVNHLSAQAIERAHTPRSKTLIGLHAPFFYDG